ncbi:MAG TPA: hypothetical protein PKY77_24770 [Phycisphaerae bacterium]|nr:hypothetical protein [Phycisphaerae bacterium]HRY71405.1 hypothetical protein [Phycisphaerae bacterium]HSA29900.1 hypothetical protein [Phycisphaerae bacterium]
MTTLMKAVMGVICVPLPLVGFALLPGCGVEGIHSANPVTRISGTHGGVSVSNTEDVDFDLAEANYHPSTKAFSMKGLKIVCNASSVRKVNVNQIDAVTRQAGVIGAAWTNGFTAAAQMLGALSPVSGGLKI